MFIAAGYKCYSDINKEEQKIEKENCPEEIITEDEISIIFRDKLGTRKGILLPQDIMKYILLHDTMAGVKKNA